MRKKGAPRKKRHRKKKPIRERHIRFMKKKNRKEARKRGKQRGHSQWSDKFKWFPNILAMFPKKKVEVKKKTKKKK